MLRSLFTLILLTILYVAEATSVTTLNKADNDLPLLLVEHG